MASGGEIRAEAVDIAGSTASADVRKGTFGDGVSDAGATAAADKEHNTSGGVLGIAEQEAVQQAVADVEANRAGDPDNASARPPLSTARTTQSLGAPRFVLREDTYNLDDIGTGTQTQWPQRLSSRFKSTRFPTEKSVNTIEEETPGMNVHKHLVAMQQLMNAYGLTLESLRRPRVSAHAKKFKGLQKLCFDLTQVHWFEALVLIIVILNTLLQMARLLQNWDSDTTFKMRVASACFQTCFMVELAIRWYGCPVYPRYTDAALMLDIFLVCLTGFNILSWLIGDTSGATSFLSGLTVLRMVRVYRLFLVWKLRPMTSAFFSASGTAFLLLLPLMTVLSASAVGMRAMFVFDSHLEGAHASENVVTYFEDTGAVFLTMLETFFSTWSWSTEVTTPLMQSRLVMSSVSWLVLQLLGTVLLANFFSAVVVQECCISGDQADRDSLRQRVVRSLLSMDRIVAAADALDPNGTGRIDVREADEQLKDHRLRRKLGLTEEQADVIVESLYQSERGWVAVDEFVTSTISVKNGHDTIEQLMFDSQVKKINADISRMRHQVELLNARFSACNLLHVEYMDNKHIEGLYLPRDEIRKMKARMDELCQALRDFPFVEEDPELVLLSDLDSQGVCHQLATLERMIATLPQVDHTEESSGVHADATNAFEDGADVGRTPIDRTSRASSCANSRSTTFGANASTDESRSVEHQGLAAVAADARFAASLARYHQVADEELAAARRQLKLYREEQAVMASTRMGHPGLV